MRFMQYGLIAVSVLLSSVLTASSALAAVTGPLLTFDDLPPLADNPSGYYAAIPNGYGGLNWNNFYYLNVNYLDSLFGANGETSDLISGTNIAFNGGGQTASAMSVSSGSPFNMSSGYFTGAWNDGLSITADAYRNGSLVAAQTFVVSSTAPTLENLNFSNIDTVTFSSSGGTPHGYASGGEGTQFALDNLAVSSSPVPEPTGLALLAGSTLGLLCRARRMRRQLVR